MAVRALPATDWLRSNWLLALILVLVGTYSLLRVSFLLPTIISQGVPPDWLQLNHGAELIASGGNPYDWDSALRFRWSPLAAWMLVPLTALGPWAWMGMQFAAVAAMPSWPLRIATLLFWPFWQDIQAGNVMTFVVLAAAWALRGNRYGIFAFLALTLIVPRPLMLPIAAWLLWQNAEWRVPFALMALTSVGLAGVTGYLPDWIGALAASTEEIYGERWGPAVWLGAPGVLLGGIAAVWLTWKGWVGAASLAISPYWLVYYPLMLVLDVPSRLAARADVPRGGAAADES